MKGKIISTKQGDVKVIEYVNSKNVLIEFQDEFKFKRKVQKSDLLKGSVKNPYFRNKNNGYLGEMYGVATKHPLFNRWDRMMSRCYNKEDNNYKTYGEVGVTVCERWHDFSKYVEDVSRMENYKEMIENTKEWNIDKDLLSGENKIYSPKTCKIIPSSENYSIPIRKSQSKRCSIPVVQISLSGEKICTFPSMRKASETTGISLGNIGQCVNGLRKSAGGFKWEAIRIEG